jgi:hypothetical protein
VAIEADEHGNHAAVCPSCGEEWLRHIEDVAAIRQAMYWLPNGTLAVNSVIDDYDYDSAHGGHLECGSCGWCSASEDFDCNEIAWDGE